MNMMTFRNSNAKDQQSLQRGSLSSQNSNSNNNNKKNMLAVPQNEAQVPSLAETNSDNTSIRYLNNQATFTA